MDNESVTIKEVFNECLINREESILTQTLAKKAINTPQLERYTAIFQKKPKALNIRKKDLDDLKSDANKIIVSYMNQRAFLSALTSKLAGSGIDIILLKSAAFNGTLYDKSAPRGSSDIDLLVHPAQKSRFIEILKKVAKLCKSELALPFEGIYEETWKTSDSLSIYLDIHFSLSNPSLFDFDLDDLFSNSVPHPLYNNAKLKVLSDDHNFVHCAIHQFTDGYLYHHSLLDAARMLEQNLISIENCHKISKDWKCERIFQFMLLALSNVFPANTKMLKVKKSLRFVLVQQLMIRQHNKHSKRRRLQQAMLLCLLTDSLIHNIKFQFRYLLRRLKLL